MIVNFGFRISTSGRRRLGFTLIELLVVVAAKVHEFSQPRRGMQENGLVDQRLHPREGGNREMKSDWFVTLDSARIWK